MCTCVMPGESNTVCFQKQNLPRPNRKPSSYLVFDCHDYSSPHLLHIFAFSVSWVAWHSFKRDYITRGTLELGGVLGVFMFSGVFCAWIETNWGVEGLYFEWASQKYESLISFKLINFTWRIITILWWVLPHIYMNQNPLTTSLPTLSLWVVPEHRLWVPCFMHGTCTGHLFYVW